MKITQEFTAEVLTGLESGAFKTHFQPKFDPDSEDIVGVEALLRWNHPERGFLHASQFIPAIEQIPDLLIRVDNWVLNNTISQAKEWLDAGYDFGFLNINISSWRHAHELITMLNYALETSNFPAHNLALECPWRLLAVKMDAIKPAMNTLRRLGCHLVLDGNPLGEDCLDIVKETPVQWSKVCFEHIQEYAESHNTAKLKSMIKKWHRRGIEVIATAVESETELALAHKAGCRYAQGQRFKSALPAEDMTQLLSVMTKTKEALSFL